MTRWASHFVDDTDDLIHLAVDYYGAKMNGPHPEMAFTCCGHRVLWNGVRANTGTYVPTSTVLTCVRCAGGAHDGRTRRAELKNAMFMEMYGQPANKVLGLYAKDDVAMTLALYSSRSILRRCARLAAVFYLKAMEAPVHERMPWMWRDPNRISHRVSKQLDKSAYVTQVSYITWCGVKVTVDDVNPSTMLHRGTPTCVHCAVVQEPG